MNPWVVTLVLVVCCGCQTRRTSSEGERTGAASTSADSLTAALVDRVWARSDSTGLPGVMRVFLSDGTLIMDSCWETYRLERWRKVSDTTLLWHEDGVAVRSTILELGEDALVLRLDLVNGSETHHYRLASVPYLCPDMPR